MTKTTTFLVGNGIGMALNPGHFSIEKGLDIAWKATNSRDIKSIIYHSLGTKRRPRNEIDLRTVQNYFFDLKCIEELVKNLPLQIRRKFGKVHKINEPYFGYLFEVAKHFFNYDLDQTPNETRSRFDQFITNFSEWIRTNKKQGHINHIVTLNYDALLFRGFYQNNLFGRFDDTHFVDGITDSGYNSKNMRPRGCNLFGWYIHLHGSPLFYSSRDGLIHKDTFNTTHSVFDDIGDYERGREHIILCHPNQKYERIKHSLILSSYYDFFEEAIRDSCSIILLGYGGEDQHINEVIARFPEKKINIIEGSSQQYDENIRNEFWKGKLKRNAQNNITLHPLRSTFDFDFSSLNS